jgi:hypothetical protein
VDIVNYFAVDALFLNLNKLKAMVLEHANSAILRVRE